MRIVVFTPGKHWPRIAHVSNINDIRAAVGGQDITCLTVQCYGRDLWVITLTDTDGLAPNRIVDGHCLYGTIVVCGYGLSSLPLPVAKDLQSDCEWPMAQFFEHEKPA